MKEEKISQWNQDIEEEVDAKIFEELDAQESKDKEQEDFEKELDEELGIKKDEVEKDKEPDEGNSDDEKDPDPEEDNQDEKEEKESDEESDKDNPDELTDEQKAKAEEEAQKKAEEEREEQLKQYSEKHDISIEDAKKDFEDIAKVIERIPEQRDLAQSYLFLQRRYTHLTEMVKEAQKPRDGFFDNHIVISGKQIAKPDVIKAYKEEYPNKTADQDDDVIYEMAKTDYNNKVKAVNDAISKEIPEKARTKRDELIQNLSADAKKFEDEIKQTIANIDDEHIVSPSFRMSTVIRNVKGRYYDRDIAAAREEGRQEGLKNGKEEAKILGEKDSTPSKGAKQKVGKTKSSLTDEQKQEARELYEGDDISEDEMFKYYKEQLDAENKKKEK